ncbi:hypothetical protein DPMN_148987 [Dreissena polymorpha]|uniref:Uncharacterized protein n=1 Tax=Dreissena polymorpha TaxID=45954 RepID=A0A9D4FGL4_DREPO|nr:hypothetical protein DPMN_148987 [Dreissena polymorpha]
MTNQGTWIQLDSFTCPAAGCSARTKGKWVCATDNSDMYINELGKMKCYNGTHIADLCRWGWNCGSSSHNGKFVTADFEGFSFALSQAVQLMTKGGSEWVSKLVIEIGKQYGNK